MQTNWTKQDKQDRSNTLNKRQLKSSDASQEDTQTQFSMGVRVYVFW